LLANVPYTDIVRRLPGFAEWFIGGAISLSQKGVLILPIGGRNNAGKSTLAKGLKEHKGFAHVNIDQLKWDRGYTKVGDDDVPDKVWDEIFSEADNLLVKHLKEGKHVANEYAWITREWRDRTRKVAREAGFQTKLIYVNIPPEIIKQRWADNIQKKDHFHWPEEEFQRVFADFEEPTPDENILIYDQTTPLDKWIEENIS
jgi:predicted kinase